MNAELITMSWTFGRSYGRSEEERLQIFSDFVKHFRDRLQLHRDLARNEIVVKAGHLNVGDKAAAILAELILDDSIINFQLLLGVMPLFRNFTSKRLRAQYYFLRGFEQAIEREKDLLLPHVGVYLKLFYDCHVLETITIINWWKNVPFNKVSPEFAIKIREKATPFIIRLSEFLEAPDDENTTSNQDQQK